MLPVLEYRLRVWRRVIWTNVTLDFVLPLLFLASIGLGLGGLVDHHAGGVAGLPYLMFIAPGVLASSAIQTGFSESSYPVIAGVRWQKHYEAIIATALSPSQIVSGLLVFIATRLAVMTSAFMIVAGVLGGVRGWTAVLAIPAAILTGLAFAAPTIAYAATLDGEGQLPLVERFVVVPMTLFAGTFFPIGALPVALQWLAMVTPLWHGVEVCRAFTSGAIDWTAIIGHTCYLLALVAIGLVLANRTLRRRLIA